MPGTLRSCFVHECAWLFVCVTTAFSQTVPMAILPGTVSHDSASLVLDNANASISQTTRTYIIPLAIGNQWTMHIVEWDTDGNITSSRNETTQILGDTSIAGERWFIMKHRRGNTICINRPDGYYVLRSEVSSLQLKYPANIGDSYEGPDGTMRVVSLNVNLSVPKGSFVCYQYETNLTRVGGLSVLNYYSPGVGFIGGQIVSANQNRTDASISGKIELVDYILH